MERLSKEEIKEIIDKLKESGKYKEYQEMFLDDFEEASFYYITYRRYFECFCSSGWYHYDHL